jgi:transposase
MEVMVMKRIRDRVGGLDVHRDAVVACARVVDPDGSVHMTKQSFSTTSKGLGELATFLSDAAVDTVAMEATGVYWKAPYYALEGLFEELWLCNAQYEEPAIMQNELAGFPFVPA